MFALCMTKNVCLHTYWSNILGCILHTHSLYVTEMLEGVVQGAIFPIFIICAIVSLCGVHAHVHLLS